MALPAWMGFIAVIGDYPIPPGRRVNMSAVSAHWTDRVD